MPRPVECEVERMQHPLACRGRDKGAGQAIIRARSCITEHAILRTVRVYYVQEFSKQPDGTKLIEDYSVCVLKHAGRDQLPVAVIGMHIISVRVCPRLAAM